MATYVMDVKVFATVRVDADSKEQAIRAIETLRYGSIAMDPSGLDCLVDGRISLSPVASIELPEELGSADVWEE